MSTTLTPSLVHPAEQRHRDHRVDDVAVLGELADPDRFADLVEPDVPRPQLDHLVLHAEVGGEPPGVAEVRAVRRADRERDAVRVHLAHLQQRQRAVQAAGEHHADGEVGVDPDPDAVLQRGADQLRRLVRVVDRRLVLAEPEQVDVRASAAAR